MNSLTQYDTLIIGAGPAGLSAALELKKQGRNPLILEKGDQVGGLMRSPRWGDFILDLGRKELYARFPEIDEQWEGVLGEDYGPYPHRVGSLYRGHIVEMSGRYRGQFRGMPLPWLVTGGVGMLAGWVRGALRKPSNYKDFWYGRVGGPFARILAQGYWEKFRGATWAAMPPPQSDPLGEDGGGFLSSVKKTFQMARRGGVSRQIAWRHPRCGTGQLFEGLADQYLEMGGQIAFDAEVTDLNLLPDGTVRVNWTHDGENHERILNHVISSLPIEQLWAMLDREEIPGGAPPPPGPESNRAVLLVYLFIKTPPRFEHAWLEVNDPDLHCGRVTNFAAFGGGMVPDGHSCLCVEYFCAGDNPILSMSEDEQIELAQSEMASVDLIDQKDLLGAHVLYMPRTNAAASWREQQSAHRSALFERVGNFKGIYHVNRPGADWASLAGIQAARAIASNDRTYFDRVADPTRRQEDRIPAQAAAAE